MGPITCHIGLWFRVCITLFLLLGQTPPNEITLHIRLPPGGDGQMEHTNQVLEQYLWVYTNYQQEDWVTLLPMAEFAYNNAMNTMTGVSPFFMNKGYHPEFTADLQVKTSSAKAEVFVVDLEYIQVELKENIAQAQERYWKNADKHRPEAPELNIGNQAYVKVNFLGPGDHPKNSQKRTWAYTM